MEGQLLFFFLRAYTLPRNLLMPIDLPDHATPPLLLRPPQFHTFSEKAESRDSDMGSPIPGAKVIEVFKHFLIGRTPAVAEIHPELLKDVDTVMLFWLTRHVQYMEESASGLDTQMSWMK